MVVSFTQLYAIFLMVFSHLNYVLSNLKVAPLAPCYEGVLDTPSSWTPFEYQPTRGAFLPITVCRTSPCHKWIVKVKEKGRLYEKSHEIFFIVCRGWATWCNIIQM